MEYREQLAHFKQAIANIESAGGNYGALGPVLKSGNRARGKYQIMSQYWDAWAKEAGVPGADWRDPAMQERVASYKFTQYFKQYRRWDAVAVAWFAGPSRAQKFVEGNTSVMGISDVLGTSVSKYVQRVNGYLQQKGVDTEPVEVPQWMNPDGVMANAERQTALTVRDAARSVMRGFGAFVGAISPQAPSAPENAAEAVAQPQREAPAPEPEDVAEKVRTVGHVGPGKQFLE